MDLFKNIRVSLIFQALEDHAVGELELDQIYIHPKSFLEKQIARRGIIK